MMADKGKSTTIREGDDPTKGIGVANPYKYDHRPAPKQCDHVDSEGISAQGAEFNIWYGKYLGDDHQSKRKLEGTKYQLDIAKHSGYTKANRDKKAKAVICLFWARGKCVHGKDCLYLHRIPDPKDEKSLGLGLDIFGRERHKSDRDDMGGTGNFNRECRTIYVAGLKRINGINLERLLWETFSQYGAVEYVRVIWGKMIAFVRFKSRVTAEFAKEAMSDQNLGHGEILNVRWAYDDPNPQAQQAQEHEVARRAAAAIIKKMKENNIPEYMWAEEASQVDTTPQPHPYSMEYKYARSNYEMMQQEAQSQMAYQQQAAYDSTQAYSHFLEYDQWCAAGYDPETYMQYYANYYEQYYGVPFDATQYNQAVSDGQSESTYNADSGASDSQATENTAEESVVIMPEDSAIEKYPDTTPQFEQAQAQKRKRDDESKAEGEELHAEAKSASGLMGIGAYADED